MIDLRLARLVVTVHDISFVGGNLQQRPPYFLSVELPALDEREFCLRGVIIALKRFVFDLFFRF
jgi:hypothetical protein